MAFISHYYEKIHMVCHLFSSSDGKSLYITRKIVLNQITSTSSVIACDITTNTWLNSVMQGEVLQECRPLFVKDAPPNVSVKFVPQFHSGRVHLQSKRMLFVIRHRFNGPAFVFVEDRTIKLSAGGVNTQEERRKQAKKRTK